MTSHPGHVLHVETGRHIYGGARQALMLIQGLHRTGIRNTLVCPHGSRIAEAAAPCAALIPLPMAGDLDPRFVLQLRGLLRRLRPDLIHVHSRRGADYWTPVAAAGFDIPLVISRRVDNRETDWLARLKYRRYDRIVAISEQIRRILIETGVPSAKIRRVYSAIPVPKRRPIAERLWLTKNLGVPKQAPLIGVVAQLIVRKGHQYLIDVLPAIREEFPEVRAVFFGQGPHEAALRRICRARGLDDTVLFAGFRRDMQRIMPCLDVVVHTATMEGLGVALLEAAACERPVVAFRAGGIPEIVDHGTSGYLVDPGDRQGLSRRIRDLLRNPQMAARMGAAGRAILSRRFDLEAMVSGNLAVYTDLWEKRAPLSGGTAIAAVGTRGDALRHSHRRR